jgi:hypothetical protein
MPVIAAVQKGTHYAAQTSLVAVASVQRAAQKGYTVLVSSPLLKQLMDSSWDTTPANFALLLFFTAATAYLVVKKQTPVVKVRMPLSNSSQPPTLLARGRRSNLPRGS